MRPRNSTSFLSTTFFMLLLLGGRYIEAAQSQLNACDNNQECNPDTPPPAPYLSICAVDMSWSNQIKDLEAKKYHQNLLADLRVDRKTYYENINRDAMSRFKEKRADGFFKGVATDILDNWAKYMQNIFDACASARIVLQSGEGSCKEATALSISQSLLSQLESNYRESIQILKMVTESDTDKAAKDDNHGFVVYNANKIKEDELFFQTYVEFETYFQNLKPMRKQHPVILCDSWDSFHGAPGEWPKHIKQNNFMPKGNWKNINIKVTQFSLPSSKDGLNDEQRAFFLNLLKEILTTALAEKPTKTSRPK